MSNRSYTTHIDEDLEQLRLEVQSLSASSGRAAEWARGTATRQLDRAAALYDSGLCTFVVPAAVRVIALFLLCW